MVTIRVSSDLVSHRKPDLRLLCLHGHGGTPARLCGNLEVFFQSVLNGSPGDPCDGEAEAFAVECRCVAAPLPEASRREGGRQWWRYDEDGYGDRPDDWAEMELATTKLAEELLTAQQADRPFDGILGFSQGAEMVHTVALLKHQDDPRFQSLTPRFVVSLSGAINPAHFESVSGGGPPLDCPGPYFGPKPNELLGLSSFVKKLVLITKAFFRFILEFHGCVMCLFGLAAFVFISTRFCLKMCVIATSWCSTSSWCSTPGWSSRVFSLVTSFQTDGIHLNAFAEPKICMRTEQ